MAPEAQPTRSVWPGAPMELGSGATLHVRQGPRPEEPAGTGVYLHGLGGAATNWTDLTGELGDLLEGLAPDLPGFGHSLPRADRDYSLHGHTRSVVAFLDRLRVQGHAPVHLFGNSLGGAVAVRVAGLRPELVATLTLVSPALPSYRPRLRAVSPPMLATPLLGHRLAATLARRTPEKQVRDTLRLCFADPASVPPQRLAEAVEEARRREGLAWSRTALVSSLRGLMQGYLERGPESLWALAARVQAPTLLVYGLRDRLVDPRTSRRAARTFPDSRLLLLPQSGHVAQMEHTDVVARAARELVTAYLSTRQGPGRGMRPPEDRLPGGNAPA